MQTSTPDVSKLDNYQKAALGENPLRQAFEVMGFTVNDHAVNDGGVDIVATNPYGVKVLTEVNTFFAQNSFFKDDRIINIDTNLVYGYEYVNSVVGYVEHSNVNYKLHICIGVNRDEYQQGQADALDIDVIYFPKLPTVRQLIDRLTSVIHYNPYNRFYKVRCNGDNNLNNDKPSMELFTSISPILSLKCSSSTKNNKESTEPIPSLAISSNNSPKNPDKSIDTALESRDTTLSVDKDWYYALSPIRQLQYATSNTQIIESCLTDKIDKIVPSIEREIATAQLEAVRLLVAALYVKILKIDEYNKNQYVA